MDLALNNLQRLICHESQTTKPNTNNLQPDLFDLLIGLEQVLPLRVRVDLKVMAMKRYSTLSRAPELESHHQTI